MSAPDDESTAPDRGDATRGDPALPHPPLAPQPSPHHWSHGGAHEAAPAGEAAPSAAAPTAEERGEGSLNVATAAPAATSSAASSAWSVDFSSPSSKRKSARPTHKTSQKERLALLEAQRRRGGETGTPPALDVTGDSEGNTAVSAAAEKSARALPMVSLDGLADRRALIPRELTSSTAAAVGERLCLRVPRLLCVNKQYPRSCGVSSLASVYNYLYSWLGECPTSSGTPPVSQEEVMSILGFEPPFSDIPWGSFTGNVTLIRWFYALNRHFHRPRGRAYILYKAHGHGKTTHLFNNDSASVLREVKRLLRDPHCALIYHCYNHYMCPIGYQDIPMAQVDFLSPSVAEESCDTTIFIGEVSRGRHEALYARKWSQIVQDIESVLPQYYNIRHPELGVQTRGSEKSAVGRARGAKRRPKAVAAADAAAQLTEPAALPPSTVSGAVESLPLLAHTPQVSDVPDAGAAAAAVPSARSPTGTPDSSALPTLAPADHPAPSVQPSSAVPRGSKPPAGAKERGNLHCLICFRNDEDEVHPELYEDASESSEGDDEWEASEAAGGRANRHDCSSDDD